MFQVSREEAQDSLLTELKHHKWDVPELWTYVKDTLCTVMRMPFEFDHDFPDTRTSDGTGQCTPID